MKKRFKSKKRIKYKYILIIIVIISIILIFNYIERNLTITLPNNKIIDIVWKSDNSYSYKGVNNSYLSQELYEYIKNNIFNSPINILKSELNYTEDKKEVISLTYVEKKDTLVYIYNSHQGETYSSKYLENYNIVPDVLMASNMLEDKLERIGITTEVENANILEYMKKNDMNHADSYKASKVYLKDAIDKYPKAKLYIDLHRDAAPLDVTITSIDGKECAKVMFVIGLENPNYKNNLDIVTKLNNIIKTKYPTLSRGILKKQGLGVNGVYNQDISSNVILIEVGGNENNIEEVNNTLDLLSIVIGEYINEEKE